MMIMKEHVWGRGYIGNLRTFLSIIFQTSIIFEIVLQKL